MSQPPFSVDATDSSKPIGNEDLVALRRLLEEVWSDDTRHPSYIVEGDAVVPSRGQCGVSSAHLLKELRRRGASDARYCRGDVTLDDENNVIVEDHCWVECGQPDDPGRYILDLTSDQSPDLGPQIVYDQNSQLTTRGIHYRAKSRRLWEELQADKVWPRVLMLEEKLTCVRAGNAADRRRR